MASDEYFPNAMSGDLIMLNEGIRVRIDDQGIYRVDGVYRTYTQTDCVPLSVSLDDALQVVQANMDSAPFYRENDTFEITQIGLCYRPAQTLDINDKDAARTLKRGLYGALLPISKKEAVLRPFSPVLDKWVKKRKSPPLTSRIFA